MVVNPDGIRVRVELDRWIVKKSTLECQEPWGPLDGMKETAEFTFDATTNLEGGNYCRHEVRGELFRDRVLDSFVLNCFADHFLLRFLESLESFVGTNIARMPPELPCRRLSDCLGQEAERHGIFGKGEVDEVVDQEWNDVE